MDKLKFIIFFLFAAMFTLTSQAQTNEETKKLSLYDGTIDDQFEYVIRKSYTYKGNGKTYKNVERSWLYTLKAHTLDSLKAVHKNLSDTKVIVDTQAKEISDLKANLDATKSNLDKTNEEKNNMSLLGIQMSKANYNILHWAIIAGLLALLILFIVKFKNSNSVTRQAKKALAETEEEFDEHRKVALEREQKVRRQLQDEINKQKGVS